MNAAKIFLWLLLAGMALASIAVPPAMAAEPQAASVTTAGMEARLKARGLDPVEVARGRVVFDTHCARCHGAEGKGNREVGAPNLTDAIWLYGGDRASITATVDNPRNGVMPRWGERLDPVTIKMLTAYVHSLGGGEAAAPAAAAPVGEGQGVDGQN